MINQMSNQKHFSGENSYNNGQYSSSNGVGNLINIQHQNKRVMNGQLENSVTTAGSSRAAKSISVRDFMPKFQVGPTFPAANPDPMVEAVKITSIQSGSCGPSPANRSIRLKIGVCPPIGKSQYTDPANRNSPQPNSISQEPFQNPGSETLSSNSSLPSPGVSVSTASSEEEDGSRSGRLAGKNNTGATESTSGGPPNSLVAQTENPITNRGREILERERLQAGQQILDEIIARSALPEFRLEHTSHGLNLQIGLVEEYYRGPPGSWPAVLPGSNRRISFLFPVPSRNTVDLPAISRYIVFRGDGRYTFEESALFRGMWAQAKPDPVQIRQEWNRASAQGLAGIPGLREYSTDIEDYLNPQSQMYTNLTKYQPDGSDVIPKGLDIARSNPSRANRDQDLKSISDWMSHRCQITSEMKIVTETQKLYADFQEHKNDHMSYDSFTKCLKFLYRDRYHKSDHRGYRGIYLNTLTLKTLQAHDHCAISNSIASTDISSTAEDDTLSVSASDTLSSISETLSRASDTFSSVSSQRIRNLDSEKALESIRDWIDKRIRLTDDRDVIPIETLHADFSQHSLSNFINKDMFSKCLKLAFPDRYGRTSRKGQAAKLRGYRGVIICG